jgi:pyrimidine operon attenuation protein/uracil phosphoribosyltransferase
MPFNGRLITSGKHLDLTLKRLSHQLLESHGDFSNTCLIGLQRTGVPLMGKMLEQLAILLPGVPITKGKLDVTFYRDDFRMRAKPLEAHPTDINFLLEGKRVILIDDVLYTGRTIRAAMDAMLHYGRPAQVELLVLVDRRLTRDLPIQPDYVGLTVDTVDESYVKVEWGSDGAEDKVWQFPTKTDIPS